MFIFLFFRTVLQDNNYYNIEDYMIQYDKYQSQISSLFSDLALYESKKDEQALLTKVTSQSFDRDFFKIFNKIKNSNI